MIELDKNHLPDIIQEGIDKSIIAISDWIYTHKEIKKFLEYIKQQKNILKINFKLNVKSLTISKSDILLIVYTKFEFIFPPSDESFCAVLPEVKKIVSINQAEKEFFKDILDFPDLPEQSNIENIILLNGMSFLINYN